MQSSSTSLDTSFENQQLFFNNHNITNSKQPQRLSCLRDNQHSAKRENQNQLLFQIFKQKTKSKIFQINERILTNSVRSSILLTITIILTLMIGKVNSVQVCDSHPYPKVLGGYDGDSVFFHSDYHASTQKLVAVGYSQDYKLKGDGTANSNIESLLACYSTSSNTLLWSKFIDTYAYFLLGVSFNSIGTHFIVYTGQNAYMIFQADGTFVDGRRIGQTSLGISEYQYERHYALSSESPPNVIAAICMSVSSGECIQMAMFKFTVGQAGSTPVWAKQYIYNKWTTPFFSIINGGTDSYIFSLFNQQNPSGTTDQVKMSRLNSANGNQQWTYGWSRDNMVNGAMAFKDFTTQQIVFFTMGRVSSGIMRYGRIRTNDLTILQTELLEDSSSWMTTLMPVAATLYDLNNGRLIHYDTAGKGVYLSMVDFANKAMVHTDIFPKNYAQVSTASFITDSIFAIPTSQGNIYMDANDPSNYKQISSKLQATLMYSDQAQSCVTLTTTTKSRTLVTSSYTLSDLTSSTIFEAGTPSITLTSLSSFGSNLIDLDVTKFTSNENFCQLVNSVYTESTLQYQAGKAKVFTLDQFQLLDMCNTPSTSITYTITTGYFGGLPAFMSFDNTKMELSVTTSGTLGKNYLMLKGTYDNGMFDYASIVVEGIPKINEFPPVYASGLVNQTVTLYLSGAYKTPTYSDVELDTITVTAVESGQAKLPAFVKFTDPDFTYNPTLPGEVGEHKIDVTLADPDFTSPYSFYIIVEDMIPPSFITAPIDITLKLNDVKSYQLPSSSDLYGLTVTTTYTPNTLAFITKTPGNLFTFSPSVCTDIGTYKMTVTLNNGFVSNYYDFNLKVTNSPPHFTDVIPTQQIMFLYDELVYDLPPFIDDEGESVIVQHIKMPSFAAFDSDSNKYTFTPTLATQLGTFKVQGKLKDCNGETPFTYEIVVTLDPPKFKQSLKNQQLKMGDTKSYNLPPTNQKGIQQYSISATLAGNLPLPSFITFSNGAFKFAPTQNIELGIYKIEVSLDDGISSPTLSQFTLAVRAAPYTADQQQNQTNSTNSSNASSQYADYLMNSADYQLKQKRAKNPEFQLYKATLRILSANRVGQVRLKVQSQGDVREIIYKLREEDISVKVKNDTTIVPLNFTIIQRDNSSGVLKLQLNFIDPAMISSSNDLDVLYIQNLNESFSMFAFSMTLLEKYQNATAQLPPQLSESMNALGNKIKDASVIAGQATVPIGLLFSVLLSMCIQFLWGLMNDLSFLTILSLISISFPGIAQIIQSALLNFIYLDILMTDKWLVPLIFGNIESDSNFGDDAITLQFDEGGFPSKQLIKNNGSAFLYLMIIVTAYLLLGMLKVTSKYSIWLQKAEKWLSGKLLWNTAVRLLIQQYPPLLISSLVNIYDVSLPKAHYFLLQLEFETTGQTLSSATSFLIVALSPLVIIVLTYIVKKARSSNTLSSDTFQSKFGNLTEGFDSSTFVGAYWNLFILWRWTLTSLILVCLKDHPEVQIMTLLLTSLIFQIIILSAKPIHNKADNRLNAFNEFMVSSYLYLLMSVTDFNQTRSMRTQIGWALVGVIFFSAIMNLGKFIVSVTTVLIREKCRQTRKMPVKKFVESISAEPYTEEHFKNQNFQEVFSMPSQATFPPSPVKKGPDNYISYEERWKRLETTMIQNALQGQEDRQKTKSQFEQTPKNFKQNQQNFQDDELYTGNAYSFSDNFQQFRTYNTAISQTDLPSPNAATPISFNQQDLMSSNVDFKFKSRVDELKRAMHSSNFSNQTLNLVPDEPKLVQKSNLDLGWVTYKNELLKRIQQHRQ